jgi:cytoskeleton protein RodZ
VEPVDDTAQTAPLGAVLARERERQGLSRSEVAQRLHMSASQVEALEAGEYERLPKGTFLRGFVRNYAKQLSLPADPLLDRLREVAPQPVAPRIVVPSQNIRFDPMSERLSNPYVRASALAAVVVALALAGMYWWINVRGQAPASSVARKAVEQGPPQQLAAPPVSVAEAPAPVEAPKVEVAKVEAPKAEPEPTTPSPALPQGEGSTSKPALPQGGGSTPKPALAQGGGSTTAVPPPPVKAARGERRLKFRFKGESWVEIKDAQGRLLMSRLNSPGSEAEVAGRPPFTVIVGNAPDVQMLYDDRAFPLEPHTKVAVARFTVE